MVMRENLTTSVLEILLNRHYITLPGGLSQRQHCMTVPEAGAVILAVVLFLQVFYLFLLWNFENYQDSSSLRRQRSRPSRTASQVLAPAARASWGPKSPARAGLLLLLLGGITVDYYVDYMTELNPHALPWRPEGSEPATRFGEA